MLVSVLVLVSGLAILGLIYVLYRAIRHESDMFLLVVTVMVAVAAMIAAAGWSHPYVVADNGTLVPLVEEAVTISPFMSGVAMISIALAVYVAVDYAYRLYVRGGR